MIDLGDSDRSELAERATELLARRIYKLRSKIEGARSITYNVASEFPLHTPGKSPFYHVRRTSVRNVLARFDRKNGVRLWCSVRRSGKTTACFDLDTTPGGSVIVPQTCGTEQTTNGRVFYDGVREAIETRTQPKATFVESVVRDCAPLSVDRADRTVLVIDEYETLFGHLRSVAESEPAIRYTVAQPLLNQMVEFARDNLLVLLGQQPGAHFILMDQNQLAPYVKQDPFPLFEHHLKTGEFSQLVDKVLRDQISVDTGFVDALHTETAGHPFLTVNVLCALVDWLIEQKRPARGITLDDGDFAQFQAEKLGPEQVSLGRHYDFFRETAKAAMGENSYRHNRWLYTAYWLVRQIAQADSGRFAIRRDDLPDLMEKIPAPGMLPETNEMLRTATQANFLSYTDAEVSVKVRTLGRLAASVRPALA
ncbi:hypothetical protein [Candidatus Palauibacter sp.]|uniref:hypothetical protein n=1 Tax=Candidatus Palauibacter sp. TaxID=3101350 RepID=UPI003B59CA0E